MQLISSPFHITLKVARDLAKLNISRDNLYSHRSKSRQDRGVFLTVNVKHAVPAQMLKTIPFVPSPDQLSSFHR